MTVFDASILVGQTFWAREQYDSARVYYNKAAAALASMESDNPPRKENDLDANRSRLWGTMGNFYAVQDSIELASFYYNKAAEIFDKYGDYQQNAILYYNLGEIRMDAGDKKQAKADYDRSLTAARQSGDSLMVAIARKGQGRWYKENGQMRKALQCLKEAEAYYANHPQEEAQSRSETLDYMTASYDALNKNMRTLAVLLALLLASAAAAFWIVFRLKRTRKELTETAAVLDETIEELRPESGTAAPELKLTPREKDVVRLLMQDKSTKMIADELGVGYETVVWYRKRLLAKFDVHTSPALIAEVTRRGLL
jgi:DNA-binding CsgD family transcriptional regulator/predicted negative regulator of RcsB-dependent stress response